MKLFIPELARKIGVYICLGISTINPWMLIGAGLLISWDLLLDHIAKQQPVQITVIKDEDTTKEIERLNTRIESFEIKSSMGRR